jgi:molybdopterin-guanine dinucleotide biosynthesis protein A
MRATDISLAILAGGRNTRFGGVNKAASMIGNLPIAERIIRSAGDLFAEILIVTAGNKIPGLPENVKYVSDIFTDCGPLGGIHAALRASECRAVFVIAGDMPFADSNLISEQIEFFTRSDAEIVIASHSDKIEPLHSIYRKEIAGRLEDFLALSQKTREFLKGCNTEYFVLPARFDPARVFMNVNTPADAERAGEIAEV